MEEWLCKDKLISSVYEFAKCMDAGKKTTVVFKLISYSEFLSLLNNWLQVNKKAWAESYKFQMGGKTARYFYEHIFCFIKFSCYKL